MGFGESEQAGRRLVFLAERKPARKVLHKHYDTSMPECVECGVMAAREGISVSRMRTFVL